MATFDTLYTEFEDTNNVCQFFEKYESDSVSTRFLLIRSLDKENLKDIIDQYSSVEATGNTRNLTKLAYESSVTIQQLLNYIESKRPTLISEREKELEGLTAVLSQIPVVNCGVRNDKVDDIVKGFVRNKSIKSYDLLIEELDNSMLPRIRQYSLWSYYNQTSNDIIELFFLKHPKVIPTLRKIHDIDFFLKLGNRIIPFDLKFTHISDSYFDLVSEGIANNTNSFDDFYVTSAEESELKQIRAFYNLYRRENRDLGLLAPSKLSKTELVDFIINIGSDESREFMATMERSHSKYVPVTSDDLKTLEWWNYKYQGERLFCNNNRLFVFLSYKTKFTDGRELKGKTEEIGKKINALLDNLSESSIHEIHYHYDKEARLVGDYTALSLSTIYSE